LRYQSQKNGVHGFVSGLCKAEDEVERLTNCNTLPVNLPWQRMTWGITPEKNQKGDVIVGTTQVAKFVTLRLKRIPNSDDSFKNDITMESDSNDITDEVCSAPYVPISACLAQNKLCLAKARSAFHCMSSQISIINEDVHSSLELKPGIQKKCGADQIMTGLTNHTGMTTMTCHNLGDDYRLDLKNCYWIGGDDEGTMIPAPDGYVFHGWCNGSQSAMCQAYDLDSSLAKTLGQNPKPKITAAKVCRLVRLNTP
jgi:hypothetical protein